MAGTRSVKKLFGFDCTLIEKMKKEELESCFIMYDDLADEFVIKFIEPKNPTAYVFCEEPIAFIVDYAEKKIVGIALLNFKKVHVAEVFANGLWTSQFEASVTRKYLKLTNPNKEKEVFSIYDNFLSKVGRSNLEKCFA